MVGGEFLATRVVFVMAAHIGALAFRCEEGTCHLLLGDISFPAVSSSERSIFSGSPVPESHKNIKVKTFV